MDTSSSTSSRVCSDHGDILSSSSDLSMKNEFEGVDRPSSAEFMHESGSSQSSDESCHDFENSIKFLIEDNFNRMKLPIVHRKQIYALMKYIRELSHDIKLPKNYTMFRKSFMNNSFLTKTLKFCALTQKLVESDHHCDHDLGVLDVFDMKKTIKLIVRRNLEFLTQPQSSFNEFVSSENYEQLWHDSIASSETDDVKITLSLNNDDAPLTKSSTDCMTPIAFSIGELPYHVRFKKENVGIACLYTGKVRCDHQQLWIHGFLEQYERIQRDPIFMHEKGRNYYLHVKTGSVIMDMVAKAKSLNMKQFNGYFGCGHCLDKGETYQSIARNKRTRKHIYPFTPRHEMVTRTHEMFISHANIAIDRGIPFHGIKGPCTLSRFMQLPDQVPVDYMHCVLLGVVKNHLKHISTDNIARLSRRMLKVVKFPHDFKRKPESLDNIARFKANTFKFWLFLLIPFFKGKISADNLAMLLILSYSIKLLSKEDLTSDLIDRAEILLDSYTEAFEQVHGRGSLTPNIHFLRHLASCCRKHGTLQDFSAFVFEGNLFNLKKYVHGTRFFGSQISREYIAAKSMHEYHHEMQINNDLPHIPREIRPKAPFNINSPKNGKLRPITDKRVTNLLIRHDVLPTHNKYMIHARIQENHEVLHSIEWKRGSQSSSYQITYFDRVNKKIFADVLYFVARSSPLFSPENSINVADNVFAVVRQYRTMNSRSFFTDVQPSCRILARIVSSGEYHHFWRIQPSNIVDVIPVSQISNRFIMIPCNNVDLIEYWACDVDFMFEVQ